MFCNVRPDCVIENLTMPSLYECPLMLEPPGLRTSWPASCTCGPRSDLTEWKEMVSRIDPQQDLHHRAGRQVYKLHDAYLRVMESLYHAGFGNESKVEINWVDSEASRRPGLLRRELGDCDGIIVPGGFGDRGIEGMIQLRSTRARTMSLLRHLPRHADRRHEYARNVLGYADANSSEFTPEGHHNVIDLMPDQQGVTRRAARCAWARIPACTQGTDG